MADQRTPQQQRAHRYYLAHRDKYLENARRWKEEHPEEMRDYQARYFQSSKGTARYVRRLEYRREKEAVYRAARPPKLKKVKPLPLSSDNQPEPIPFLTLYTPEPEPEPEPELPQPLSYTVSFS